MAEKNLFVDTNVWVARMLEDHHFHQRAKDALDAHKLNGDNLHISSQIVREIISVCTLGRGLSRSLTWDELHQEITACHEFSHSIRMISSDTMKLKLSSHHKGARTSGELSVISLSDEEIFAND